MQGAATQAMPVCIVEERQRRRCPAAAAPRGLQLAGPSVFLSGLLVSCLPLNLGILGALPAGLRADSKM